MGPRARGGNPRLAARAAIGALLTIASAAGAQQCDRPVSPWLLLGPFPVDSGAARVGRTPVGDPVALAPRAGESIAGRTWLRADADTLGRIDFLGALTGMDFDASVAYAATYVGSPAPRSLILAVESDDDVRVWVNGHLVHAHAVARGVASGTDTVPITLDAGVNRIVYEVTNRSGGFGMGARLLARGGAIGDLAFGATSDEARAAPASEGTLRVGPVRVATPARLTAGGLTLPLIVCASRAPGRDSTVILAVGSELFPRTIPAGDSASGWGPVVPLEITPSWESLAAAWLADHALRVTGTQPNGTPRIAAAPLTASALLDVLARPIDAGTWRTRVDGRDTAIMSLDSLTRRAADEMHFATHIPNALAGLTLRIDAAELTGADIRANGSTLALDSAGRATLCAPCRPGAPLDLALRPRGTRWWDAPSFRVSDPGWHEVREGARWARVFTGDSTFAVPDSAVADALLRAALDPSKRAYQATIDEWTHRLAPAAARIRRDTIDIVGNSHIDAAWLWRWMETVDVVDRTWSTATKLLAKYPQMHFAASAAQYYEWLAQRDTATLHRIQALERAGRWNLVGGWWLEPDENMPSGESLVRQGLYGQRTFIKLFGHPAHVAWTPDSFGYPWSLPQIFAKSGLDMFVTQKLRWNDTNKWPARLNAFWWEGPDGTRVFTYIPYGYDHDLDPATLARQLRATVDSSATPRLLTLYGVGDHGGGPTMEMLERAQELKRIPTFPVLRDAAPDSSLARMARDLRGKGPVVRDELYLEYHRGVFTTQSEIKRWNRRLESELRAAEAAAAVASALPYPRDSLREAWERVLFNQFHDILSGSGIAPIYADAAVDYRHADSIATTILARSVRAIAAPLDTRAPTPRFSPPPVANARAWTPYTVFNPTGVARGGTVVLPQHPEPVAMDAAGNLLPVARMGAGTAVIVPTIRPLGTRLIWALSGAAILSEPHTVVRAGVLENRWLSVLIDTVTGDIASLVDRRTGRSMLGPNANGLVLLADNPKDYDAWNIDDLRGARTWLSQATVRIEGETIVIERDHDSTHVVQRYRLAPDAPRLDIETDVEWHEAHQLLKAVFPLPFHVESTRAEIPYASIARFTVPRTRHDSARFEVPMQRWVDASTRTLGVALVNDGKYGYSASGDTVMLTLLRAPKYPDSMADIGHHHFTYAVVPHTGDWRAAAIRDAARALDDPLVAVAVDEHAGVGRVTPSLLSVTGAGVELGAFKRGEDDDALIVRLVETNGRATTATLRVPGAVTARETDLLERPLTRQWHSSNCRLAIPLRPFEIVTLAVRSAARRSDARQPLRELGAHSARD